MRELFVSFLLSSNFIATNVILAYSKVSINGQARSNPQDVAFTVSSTRYSTPKTIKLLPGEAFDHPSTPKYLEFDETTESKLDGLTGRHRMLERFHPPASFEHVLSHSKGQKEQFGGPNSPLTGSSTNDVVYSKPIVSMTFDYPPPIFNAYSKPMSPPLTPSPQVRVNSIPLS
ncbi:hypothetical protein QAD02_020209 [Eretmocerus hayati]|uniref:Uncharacterized protein n=1 Tax=Eretmocerus hayati TaxID=131215 RepID=A0ACC2PPZ7_9HYME|nr:hypothetical protein QAD02_020209 [Eretmocerus hayati]